MKILSVPFLLAAFACLSQAQALPQGSRVYIDDAAGFSASLVPRWLSRDTKIQFDAGKGFDFYLTAALQAKGVPLVIVMDRSTASYVLEGTWEHVKSFGPKQSVLTNIEAPLFNNRRVSDYDGASIRLIDIKTNEVVFAYSVDRNNAPRGRQSAAESIAKHLKTAMASRSGALASNGGTGSGLTATIKSLLKNTKDPALDF